MKLETLKKLSKKDLEFRLQELNALKFRLKYLNLKADLETENELKNIENLLKIK